MFSKPKGKQWKGSRRRQAGSAVVEYLIVATVLVGVLFFSSAGHASPLRALADALREAYSSFVYALSVSWI